MKLNKLLEAVGEKKVAIQYLDHCATSLNQRGASTKITFGTDQRLEFNGSTRDLGIVVWLDRDAVKAAFAGQGYEAPISPVLDDDAIEAMVDEMVRQSTAYPVVPPGYAGQVDRLHPFAARQCLLAALRSRPELAAMLPGNPDKAEEAVA